MKPECTRCGKTSTFSWSSSTVMETKDLHLCPHCVEWALCWLFGKPSNDFAELHAYAMKIKKEREE